MLAPATAEYMPTAQLMQVAEVARNWPAAHAAQDVAPAVAVVPEGQGAQAVAVFAPREVE